MALIKENIEIKGVMFKNFLNLNDDEKLEILGWRNHETVRNFMLTKEIIPLENHLSFLKSLETSTNKAYWVAQFQGMNIGVVDLYDIEPPTAYWGYYLNHEFLGSSYGILLEYLVLEIAFNRFHLDELWCESLTINKNVIKTHKTFGYAVMGEKNDCTIQRITHEEFEKHNPFYTVITSKFFGK